MPIDIKKINEAVRSVKDDMLGHKELRDELKRLLGPTFDPYGRAMEDMLIEANDRLEALKRSGRQIMSENADLLTKYIRDRSSELRKLIVRIAPMDIVQLMERDASSSVKNMINERHKMINEEMLGDNKPCQSGEGKSELMRQQSIPELSAGYYENLARKFCADFHVAEIEKWWVAPIAKQFATHTNATSGVKIDEEKLLKAINEFVAARDERISQRVEKGVSIKETIDYLNERALMEDASSIGASMNKEDVLDEAAGYATYIKQFNERYAVKESTVPASLRKFCPMKETRIPVIGTIPGGMLRENDEHLLDAYVIAWNKRQEITGNPIRIAWHPSGGATDGISFSVELK
jgi:hypothetical protein